MHRESAGFQTHLYRAIGFLGGLGGISYNDFRLTNIKLRSDNLQMYKEDMMYLHSLLLHTVPRQECPAPCQLGYG